MSAVFRNAARVSKRFPDTLAIQVALRRKRPKV
jgi:hypothetical protein